MELHERVDDGLKAQLQFASFDFGQIENIVDEFEQIRACLMDRPCVIPIAGCPVLPPLAWLAGFALVKQSGFE